MEYFDDSDDNRVLEIKVPKVDGVDFNFNQSPSDWYYDPYGDDGNGILRYTGTFIPNPATGRVIIEDELNFTFSTVQLARKISETADGYAGNQTNDYNLFDGEFQLHASSTDNNNTKLQTLTPLEVDIAVYVPLWDGNNTLAFRRTL